MWSFSNSKKIGGKSKYDHVQEQLAKEYQRHERVWSHFFPLPMTELEGSGDRDGLQSAF